jgi:hypothetical protein
VKRICILFAVIVLLAVASCLFAFNPTDPDRTEVFVLKDGSKKNSKAWFHSWFSSDPTADEIVAHYLKVTGWEANPSALTSFVAKGRFSIWNEPGETLVQTHIPYRVTVHLHWSSADGDVEIEGQAPDKIVITQKYYGTVFQRGTNGGKAGWSRKGLADKSAEVNPQIRFDHTYQKNDMKGDRLTDLKRGADFINYFRLPNKYPRLYLTGKTMVGDRIAYELSNRTFGEGADFLYFDVETGMLLKIGSYRHDKPYIPLFDQYVMLYPDSGEHTETYLEDYREINGVKLPFLFRQHIYKYWVTTAITELQTNVHIDASVFENPASDVNTTSTAVLEVPAEKP